MGWFWKGVGTLIVGILVGVVVVASEDRVKGLFAERTLHAEVYPSAWYPYPIGRTMDPAVLLRGSDLGRYEIEALTTGTDPNFAMIELRNRGHKVATNVRFQHLETSSSDGSPMLPPHLLVVPAGKQPRRSFHSEAVDVGLPDIEPGSTITLYMWRIVDLSSEYNLPDFRLISDDGVVPVRLHNYDDRESKRYNEPAWYTWIDEGVPVVLFGLLLLLSFVGIVAAAMYEAYMKNLLADDNLYLNEKVRYDADPKKFQIDTKIIS